MALTVFGRGARFDDGLRPASLIDRRFQLAISDSA